MVRQVALKVIGFGIAVFLLRAVVGYGAAFIFPSDPPTLALNLHWPFAVAAAVFAAPALARPCPTALAWWGPVTISGFLGVAVLAIVLRQIGDPEPTSSGWIAFFTLWGLSLAIAAGILATRRPRKAQTALPS